MSALHHVFKIHVRLVLSMLARGEGTDALLLVHVGACQTRRKIIHIIRHLRQRRMVIGRWLAIGASRGASEGCKLSVRLKQHLRRQKQGAGSRR